MSVFKSVLYQEGGYLNATQLFMDAQAFWWRSVSVWG